MFLITEGYGTHESTRVYFNGDTGDVRISDRTGNRIGPATVSQIDFFPAVGLYVTTNHGVMFAPVQDCQITFVPE